MKPRKKLLAAIMQKITGFKAVNAWSKEEFIKFLENNSYRIIRVKSLKASFPLTYVECKQMVSIVFYQIINIKH